MKNSDIRDAKYSVQCICGAVFVDIDAGERYDCVCGGQIEVDAVGRPWFHFTDAFDESLQVFDCPRIVGNPLPGPTYHRNGD